MSTSRQAVLKSTEPARLRMGARSNSARRLQSEDWPADRVLEHNAPLSCLLLFDLECLRPRLPNHQGALSSDSVCFSSYPARKYSYFAWSSSR
jgi:hypothetical protein